MKLYVLRHGETDYNVEKRISGHVPAKLTELGKQQAIEAGKYLEDKGIEYIYCSPFQRAIDTANLANISHIEMEIDDRLKEVNFGIFEGLPIDTKEFYVVKHELGHRYPEGETYLEVIYRIYSFIDDLKQTDYECVLVVCHGAILRAFNAYFHDMSNEDFFNYRTKNCQINEYELVK